MLCESSRGVADGAKESLFSWATAGAGWVAGGALEPGRGAWFPLSLEKVEF